MNTQQQSRPVITPAMREQAAKQPNTWLYVVDPIFTDPSAEIPPWGFIGGYRVDERGQLTDDFSPNPNYRPSPVALRLPAPTNDLERALQLTTTGYAQGQTLLIALLDAEVILFAQPQGSGLFTMEHESGRRQLQMFTSDAYLPSNWTTWQRMTGRALANQKPNGLDLQINPTSPIKARVPGEDLIKAAGLLPQQAPETAAGAKSPLAIAAAPTNGAIAPVSGPNSAAAAGSSGSDGSDSSANSQTAAQGEQPQQSEPEFSRPATDPVETELGRRFLGSLLAGAVADALGSAIEFYPVDQIRSRYGERGVTDYERDGGRPGEFTDDTQMTLFTAEGLVRGHIAIRKGLTDSALPAVQLAYQRWLHTQGYAWSRASGPFAERHPEPTGWLIKQRDLFSVRSPNSNGITALREFASVGAPATFERPINDADDCGGVVRAAPVALWSDDPAEVFELAAATAALTYSHPNGYLPAGTFAVLVHRLLRGESLDEGLRRARSLLADYSGHEETERLLGAAHDLAQQDKLTPEQIKDTLGSGWTGHEALAIAVCAALNTETIASAVMMAINHSGDSDSTGAICGNIVGALHGSASVPGVWLRDLKQRETIETLAMDALIEFSSAPSADPGWLARYPADQDGSDLEFSSTPPKATPAEQQASQPTDHAGEVADVEPTPSQASVDSVVSSSPVETSSSAEQAPSDDSPSDDSQGGDSLSAGSASDEAQSGLSPTGVSQTGAARTREIQTREVRSKDAKVLGCLLGGAAGDALGYPIEDESIEGIRAKYGALGLTDFVDAHRPGGSISDDTQMTLFTLEGLIRAGIRRRLRGESDPAPQVQQSYQRWLHTQGFDWKEAGGPHGGESPDGWLIRQKGLFVRRAPGTTCVQALHAYASGQPIGTFSHRINRSNGRGGVMRAAPAGFWSDDPTEAFRAGAVTAVLTYGHASGFLPAGALAVIVQQLLANRSIPEAVDRALTELSTWDDHEQTSSELRKAIELAATTTPTPEQIQERLGSGEAGEQALAIAVCAALTHAKSFSAAVSLAANHSGNSDSTAAICGNIVGAANGVGSIPPAWREKLELRETIEELGHDAVREFGPTPPTGSDWLERYPVETTPADADVTTSSESPVSTEDSADSGTAAAVVTPESQRGPEESREQDAVSAEQRSGSEPSTQRVAFRQAATTAAAASSTGSTGTDSSATPDETTREKTTAEPSTTGAITTGGSTSAETAASTSTREEAGPDENGGAAVRAENPQQTGASETTSVAEAMFGSGSGTASAPEVATESGAVDSGATAESATSGEAVSSTAAAPAPAEATSETATATDSASTDRDTSSGTSAEEPDSAAPAEETTTTGQQPAEAGEPATSEPVVGQPAENGASEAASDSATVARLSGLGQGTVRAEPEESRAAQDHDRAGPKIGPAWTEARRIPDRRESAGTSEHAEDASAPLTAPASIPAQEPEQAGKAVQAANLEQSAKPEQTGTSEQAGTSERNGTLEQNGESEQAAEADDSLSDEELRLLTAWRKFRESDEDTPSDLDQGLRKLLVEAFGAERAAQLVGDAQSEAAQSEVAPSDSAEFEAAWSAEAEVAPARQLSREQRLEGCVLGGAVGDALAAPWMFASLHTTLRNNPDGVRAVTEHFGKHGSATALGQQSVFVLDGLLRASIHTRLRGVPTDTANMVLLSLQHWVCTQGARFDPALPVGLLTESSVLREQRFPDETSLVALTRARSGVPTPGNPPNDARGATAVTRGALAGFHADTPEEAVSLGSRVAVLTHGHPDGHLPAGALAGMIAAIRDGQTIADSAQTALTELKPLEGGENTAHALRSALELAERGPVSPTSLEELGDGWDAPEALAIGVAAALARPGGGTDAQFSESPFSDSLSLAATHSGNGVATAAICGSLLGAAHGVESIPCEWLRDLELAEILRQLLTDDARVADEIHDDQPAPDWANRYLG